jgi:hypothetical protein
LEGNGAMVISDEIETVSIFKLMMFLITLKQLVGVVRMLKNGILRKRIITTNLDALRPTYGCCVSISSNAVIGINYLQQYSPDAIVCPDFEEK